MLNSLSWTFRTVRLRGRRSDCVACGASSAFWHRVDYEEFCGGGDRCGLHTDILSPSDRITPTEYRKLVHEDCRHLLLDVRPVTEYNICRLPGAINIPLSMLDSSRSDFFSGIAPPTEVIIVCRRGNDSQLALPIVKKLLTECSTSAKPRIRDLKGGLQAWATENPEFPIY